MSTSDTPRPTPETDAEICTAISRHVVRADFASKLERERDEAREEKKVVVKWTQTYIEECNNLRAENAALRADKARLEFLLRHLAKCNISCTLEDIDKAMQTNKPQSTES